MLRRILSEFHGELCTEAFMLDYEHMQCRLRDTYYAYGQEFTIRLTMWDRQMYSFGEFVFDGTRPNEVTYLLLQRRLAQLMRTIRDPATRWRLTMTLRHKGYTMRLMSCEFGGFTSIDELRREIDTIS